VLDISDGGHLRCHLAITGRSFNVLRLHFPHFVHKVKQQHSSFGGGSCSSSGCCCSCSCSSSCSCCCCCSLLTFYDYIFHTSFTRYIRSIAALVVVIVVVVVAVVVMVVVC